MRKLVVIAFYLAIVVSCTRSDHLRLVTFNVQNLFDDQHDGSEYSDFSEVSRLLYEQKLSNLAFAIDYLARVEGSIDLLLLQEVENSAVVYALADYTKSLQGLHVMFAKEPTYATGVAILSRYDVIEVMSLQILDPLNEQSRLRPILLALLALPNGERLLVANVHLQSQSQDNNWLRRSASLEQLYLAVEQMKRRFGDELKVVIGGDFNMDLSTTNELARSFFAIKDQQEVLNSDDFYNPWVQYLQNLDEEVTVRGSYAYQAKWQALDGFLLSASLLTGQGLTFVKQHPFGLEPFIVHAIDEFSDSPISYPRAFYQGRVDGVSDHLPVVSIFKYNTREEKE